MRNWMVFVILCSGSTARAEAVGGTSISLVVQHEVEDFGVGGWAAGTVGAHGYVGGEVSLNSYVTPSDAGVSYHVLGGVQSRLSRRTRLLADLGAGITQHFVFHLGILGGESGFETAQWLPSGAARVHLVSELGRVHGSTVGVALSSEARLAIATGDANAGIGFGLGLFVAR